MECSDYYKTVNPIVALNSLVIFIKPLPIDGPQLNQQRSLDQTIGNLWKAPSTWLKLPFYLGMQLIQAHFFCNNRVNIQTIMELTRDFI